MAVSRLTNIVFKILLACLSTIVVIACLELVARLKYTPRKVVFINEFEYDTEKKYALKKNYQGYDITGTSINTNQYGYRSPEINKDKEQNEWRVLFLGDSITYGHGVETQYRFTEQYQLRLNQNCATKKISFINTGVPGYSSHQQYIDFTHAISFNPDVVVIQFTLNDVTEPFNFQKTYGGDGFDYHKVADTTYWHYVFSQESALYLYLYDLSKQIKFGTKDDAKIREIAIKSEWLNDQQLVDNPSDERQVMQWQEYFKWFDKIADLCHQTKKQCYVLISPYTFQFMKNYDKAFPQQKLIAHAQEKGIKPIDMLVVLQEKVKQTLITQSNLDQSTSYSDLLNLDFTQVVSASKAYFLDHSHYSILGHQIIADTLLENLPNPCLID